MKKVNNYVNPSRSGVVFSAPVWDEGESTGLITVIEPPC